MSKKSKIAYDKESGVLSIEMKAAKSVDSDVQGNAVVDYDKKGDIVRVSLYNFNFDAFREGVRPLKEFARRSGALLMFR